MPTDRELIAQREIGHTDIAPWLSRTLTAVFLATIAVVPAIQTAYDLGQWRRGERAGALPQSVDALRLPAVDHLMGPGFIDERELAWAADRGDELGEPRHSDPMPAILEFRNQLANRGIELLLVPVPVKAAVYPELLSERYAGGGEPLSNPSFANFLAELADRQVRVLDPTPLIAEAKESDGELQYLRTDTHWTPRAVDLVADRLATTVRGLVDLEQMDAVRYTSEAAKIRNTGDLAEMLDPRKAPYADYIVGLHLVDVTSDKALEGDQALVFTWAMRGRRLTAGAGYRVGQRLRLELRPWADVTRELESVARGELYENNLLLETPCWGEETLP